MSLSSIQARNQRTADCLAIKRSSDGYDNDTAAISGYADELRAKRAALVARLSHILDAKTLESMGIARLEEILNDQPSVMAANLMDRLGKLQAKFDQLCPASDPVVEEPEVKEPTVELDPEAVLAFNDMCRAAYCDTMNGVAPYEFSDACDDDFDESTGEYIYRTVN